MSKPALLLSQKTLAGGLGRPVCTRTPLCVESVNAAQRYYSLAQYKRLKQKSTWVSKDDPNMGPDADFFLPERKVMGVDPLLNRTLHKYKIIPSKEAFRNLHLRGLVMLANGKTDKSKALHVPVANDEFKIYFGDKAPSFLSSTKPSVIPIDQYKQIVKEIKDHMSATPSIVVHDGAVGSHSKYEVRARIVSDDPAAALYLHHVIPRINVKGVQEFQHDITVYVVPNFKPSADSLAKYGISGERFVIVDVARSIAIVGGPLNTSAIRAGIVAVSQPKFAVDHQAVPLDASVVGVKGAESPVLVVGNTDAITTEGGLEVHGAHNVAWTNEGLVRFFDGTTSSVSKGVETLRGDLIENLTGSSRVTTRKAPTANIHSHPSAVVLLVDDSTNVLPTISQVSKDYVSQFLLAGFSGKGFKPLYASSVTSDPHGVAASFGSLVKQNNVPVYVVNVSAKDAKLSNAQVSSLIKAVASGSVKDAPVLSNVFSKISPLTSIKGLDLAVDPTKRGWDANSLKTEATKLEKSISDYLSSTFPPPPPPPQQK